MRTLRTGLVSLAMLACGAAALSAADASVQPVTPNPSSEAVSLLRYVYGISGKHTLAGQHCVPLVGSTRLASTYKQVKRYPALFGQDFGFSPSGTWDGINYRQRIVDEAIQRYYEGFVITLMWHAVRPIEDEPVEFESSIQGKLTDQQWQDLVTPGAEVNERWKSQVDVIAWFLKQLRDAGVPVLWRPYHEMNGGWFWWGKKTGDAGYRKLYRMLFERLVGFHKLNNLIWVFNGNEVREGADPYDAYFPGSDVVDVLATDVYQSAFAKEQYEGLLAVAGGKPIALGEVGRPPTAEILRDQPRWAWFMSWGDAAGMWREGQAFRELYESDAVLTLDELPWAKVAREPKTHYPVLR